MKPCVNSTAKTIPATRTLRSDINYIRTRATEAGVDVETVDDGNGFYYRYSEPDFSIFKRGLGEADLAQLKEAYDLVHKLRSIFKSSKLTRNAAKVKLHEWYQAIADCSLREVKSARDAIKDREEYVLNYFINRATNAAAESLNSKLKGFRAQVRGVSDLPFFMYRVCQIFG